ncbi:MAG: PQQ-dependent sugar dehydrogenase [Candidatus Woesearchaeota archaeon]
MQNNIFLKSNIILFTLIVSLGLLITGCSIDTSSESYEDYNDITNIINDDDSYDNNNTNIIIQQETEEKKELIVEIIREDLKSPWGMDFISNNKIIITEKVGSIVLLDLDTNETKSITGVPELDVIGQGGLLDVVINDNEIYLTYSKGNGNGFATHIGKGILDLGNYKIKDFKILYIAEPFMNGGAHFGSRILLIDEYLFFTTGDRGQKNFGLEHVSQNTFNSLGKVIRLYKNGSIPKNNPFIDDENILDSIYTYGHRNIQGIALNKQTNEIWISEHGERDGDSISILEAGGNYGWPITHYGCHYGTNRLVADPPHENPEIINPVHYWECGSGGFPPAGMTFYYGDKFNDWNGNLFVGNLAGQYLGRFEVFEDGLVEHEPLLANRGWRIRDVKQSPNDEIYVLVDGNPGKIIRLTTK